jgi:beta-galactosidase beta subunit
MMAGLAPKKATDVSTDKRNVSTNARTECEAMEAAVNLTEEQYTQAKEVHYVYIDIHLRV